MSNNFDILIECDSCDNTIIVEDCKQIKDHKWTIVVQDENVNQTLHFCPFCIDNIDIEEI